MMDSPSFADEERVEKLPKTLGPDRRFEVPDGDPVFAVELGQIGPEVDRDRPQAASE
jgi:hypothetical protein